MSEPLWSDADIRTALTQEQAVMVAERIRDDYERRIAELEAQLAQRSEWQPVGEDVKIESPIPGDNRYMIVSAINEDGDHGLTISDVEFSGGVIMPLPGGYALCRRASSDA